MSIDGEQEFRQRLGQALGTVTAGPAPVDRAVRQGRTIRVRRRLVAVAAAAAAAATAVAVPAVLARQAADNAVTSRHPTITVHPPGPHAPAGLIAWGRVGSRRWAVRVTRPGADGAGRGEQCVYTVGTSGCGGRLANSGPDPAFLDSLSAGQVHALYGAVTADVSYLTVRLAGGQVLTLHPVSVFGGRAVAFAVPSDAVTAITAYSRHGVLATAIPFEHAGQGPTISNWLRPGQAGLPRATGQIGAGDGWSAAAYQGPWGRCLVVDPGGSVCTEGTAPLGTSIFGWAFGSPRLAYGSAAAAVAHVVVRLSDGSSVRVAVTRVGGQKYFAFALPSGATPRRWLAYDSHRRGIASGRVG